MKDYIFKVSNLEEFIIGLSEQAKTSTPWAMLDYDKNPKLMLSKTGIIPHNGIMSVSIIRLTPEQLSWGLKLPTVSILGEARESYIKTFEDVKWRKKGKAQYYEIYSVDPTEHKDENGETFTINPPLLHCVLAS